MLVRQLRCLRVPSCSIAAHSTSRSIARPFSSAIVRQFPESSKPSPKSTNNNKVPPSSGTSGQVAIPKKTTPASETAPIVSQRALEDTKFIGLLGAVQKQAVQQRTFQNSYEVQRKKDGELLQAQLPKDAKFLGGIYKHFPQYDHVEADFVDFEPGNFTMPFNFKPNGKFTRALIGFGYTQNGDIRYVESGTQLFDPYTDQIVYDIASHKFARHKSFSNIMMKLGFLKYQTEPGENGIADSIAEQKRQMLENVPKDFKGKFYFWYHSLACSSVPFDATLVKAKGWGKQSEFRAYNPPPCIDEATSKDINTGTNIENTFARNDIITKSADALSFIGALLSFSDVTRAGWEDRTTKIEPATAVGRFKTFHPGAISNVLPVVQGSAWLAHVSAGYQTLLQNKELKTIGGIDPGDWDQIL